MRYNIGVDIGTTSTKVILFDEKNRIRAQANIGYPTFRPSPGFAEQDPLEVYRAFETAVRQLTQNLQEADEVAFISFSAAMHGLIAVDEVGEPLTNMMIWADNRAANQIDKMKQQDDWLSYYRKTGTPVHPMSPFAKLLWIKEETDLLSRAHKFIGIKEFIFHRLIGEYVVDYSIASATGLFNIHTLEWDKEILSIVGIRPEQLAKPVEVTTAFTLLDPRVLGLSPSANLVVGASDGCLANLGTAATNQGDVAFTIGTSGALRMTVDRPLLDEQGRTFCYYLSPGRWVIGGAVNNGGNVIQWLNDLLYEGEHTVYEAMPQAIKETTPGAEGLFFFPYINGERAPFWDGSLRGTYHGLSSFHTKAHFIRATLEGILFNLKEVFEIVEEIGGAATAIKASGGFLQSAEWAQLAADILGMGLTVIESPESSSLGAVLLVDEKETFERAQVIEPDTEREGEYAQLFQQYQTYREKILQLG